MADEVSGGSAAAADDLDLFDADQKGQSAAKTETTIPDKYAGKTVEDLIKMHQNAERKISQQGAEVSTLRKLSDQILELKKPATTETKEQHRAPVTVDALLADPEKAIKGAVDTSELAIRAQRAEDRVARLESSITHEKFVAKHANFAQDLQNPDFVSWVQKNPVRASLGQAASQNNFEAALNLWDMWEEAKGAQAPPVAETKKTPKVPSGVKAAPSSNGEISAPTYSRAKLMDLRERVQRGDPSALSRWNDPEFQRRMHQAYADDRVR